MRLLGEILRENFGLSEESIEAALAIQGERGGRIGEGDVVEFPRPFDVHPAY